MARKKKTVFKPEITEYGALIVYSYSPVTGEYVGYDEAYPDPMEPGSFLIPANATQVQPPIVDESSVAVWNGTEWTLEPIPVPNPEPEPTEEDKAKEARADRNALLDDSDWTQLPDVPEWVTTNLAAWRTYRQALRDVPQQDGFPETINWPEKP